MDGAAFPLEERTRQAEGEVGRRQLAIGPAVAPVEAGVGDRGLGCREAPFQGFTPLARPATFMERHDPDVYARGRTSS